MTIETIGKVVLAVLIAIGLILFIMYGILSQANIYNQTGSGLIGNLSDIAHQQGGQIIQ